MNNFTTLYTYELKKICKRKIVWITMGILLVIAGFMGISDPLTSGYSITTEENTVYMNGFEFLELEKNNAKGLIGRSIDDALLEEVREAYKGIYRKEHTEVNTEGGRSILGEAVTTTTAVFANDTDEGAVEENVKKREQYVEIYSYVHNIMGNYDAIHSINADMLYQARLNKLQSDWTEQRLTREERTYWEEKEDILQKPFVYGYAEGWMRFLREFLILDFMLVLAMAICLSTVFSNEHLRKTDQLILCSKYGKNPLFFSKLAAGVTFGLGSGAALLFVAMLSTLCVYGAEGFHVAVQIYLPVCSRNLTVGQAVLFMGMVYVVIAVLYSMIAMFLSEAMENSVAVMGIMTGSMCFTLLVEIPFRFRMASQIYDLLPTNILKEWELWDNRLLNVFGVYFTNYQAAPVIYIIVTGLLILWGNRLYKNYQVSGR